MAGSADSRRTGWSATDAPTIVDSRWVCTAGVALKTTTIDRHRGSPPPADPPPAPAVGAAPGPAPHVIPGPAPERGSARRMVITPGVSAVPDSGNDTQLCTCPAVARPNSGEL